MGDQDPGSAARTEAARQAVALAALILAVPVVAWLERKASSPDAMREWRMRALKAGERAAAQSAAACWQLAERARQAYERERA